MAARQTRAQLEAARLLTVITEPRRQFPPWQILEPPPADVLLGYYREAQRRTGVPWTYLAAIHLVETRMGRIRGPSTAGALGPMQFMPATWDRYGAGGDINDPRDAIMAAARLLADHGAPRDMATALWHYNNSDKYVGAVTAYARTMRDSPATYRGYWSWQVFCQLRRGAFVLPVGYPHVRPVPLPAG
jgi:soluble lytic murein transglycosylase-like protein